MWKLGFAWATLLWGGDIQTTRWHLFISHMGGPTISSCPPALTKDWPCLFTGFWWVTGNPELQWAPQTLT